MLTIPQRALDQLQRHLSAEHQEQHNWEQPEQNCLQQSLQAKECEPSYKIDQRVRICYLSVCSVVITQGDYLTSYMSFSHVLCSGYVTPIWKGQAE